VAALSVMSLCREEERMEGLERWFARGFEPWGIQLPPGVVEHRQRGRIVQAGWTIWYLFGRDGRGEYFDSYASHRMTSDSHLRWRPGGEVEALPVMQDLRLCAKDPEADARLASEYLEHNRQVARMLEEKGFGIRGGESAFTAVNRFLREGGDEA
jgi:hypothetical protein